MRVVIADDSGIFRKGLRLLLESVDIHVAADVDNILDLVRVVGEHRPDVCILDVRMPPTHTDEGIRAALMLRSAFPDVGVLVLSTYTVTAWAEHLLGDGRGGVGYLLKDRVDDIDGLCDALRRVSAGGTAVDNEVVSALVQRRRRAGGLDRLTEREREVLSCMAQGMSNAGIARTLHLSTKTIEANVASVFSTLGLVPSQNENRRVRAVLTFLRNPPPPPPPVGNTP